MTPKQMKTALRDVAYAAKYVPQVEVTIDCGKMSARLRDIVKEALTTGVVRTGQTTAKTLQGISAATGIPIVAITLNTPGVYTEHFDLIRGGIFLRAMIASLRLRNDAQRTSWLFEQMVQAEEAGGLPPIIVVPETLRAPANDRAYKEMVRRALRHTTAEQEQTRARLMAALDERTTIKIEVG